ncbi:BTAD domain-containing putative transcriptional regulator [Nonomuraea longicatena]|uniref:BTAD domain-containing putative transcriptional regulator n=1 Tax=Nonomuraea longicatena TaxID=83682 RepID=A0ABN1NLY1_9ACTN
MRFGILGPLAVWTADGRPVHVPEAKVRTVLAVLLAHGGRPVPADRLIDDLWGERLPARPAAVLQTKVSQLRKALQDAEPGGRALVVSEPAGFALRAEPGSVDADRFSALVARAYAAGDSAGVAASLADALALWRGPAFGDLADRDFARAFAVRLEEERLAATERLAEARLDLGEHRLLVAELGDLVERHPLRERLRAAHIRALYGAGRQAEALAGYERLRERLDEELGVTPGPELAALHQAVLRQDPSLEAAPGHRPRTNLPAARTDLVGREWALAHASALLTAQTAPSPLNRPAAPSDTPAIPSRLVTLTGPGGVGKTRLALEIATRLLTDAGLDGVWLVELGLLEHSAHEREAAEAISDAVGLRDDADSPGDPATRLLAALRTQRALIVLDNVEHVVEPVAALTDRLLKAAPGLLVLATGREPLDLSGEVVLHVPPLDLPDPAAPAPPRAHPAPTAPAVSAAPASVDLAALTASGAVRLFVARAAAAAPGFALDAGNAEAVREVCRRLDGIPLALELAAAKVHTLGVHEVSRRLDDRFRLLVGRRRDAPARQQTLRAVIDWSWSLLTEPERVLLRRLAVHHGGCTLESAEQVCAGEAMAAADVADVLGRLVDRSLVVMANDGGRPRYRLLESIAAYSLERLREAGEHEVFKRRHRAHYTALAERGDRHLRGHDQRRWLRRLDGEGPNLRAALDCAIKDDTPPSGDAARLVGALAWYWVLRGRLGEGCRALAAVLEVDPHATARGWLAGLTMFAGADHPVPPEAGADDLATWFAAFAAVDFGDLTASERLTGQVLDRFLSSGDDWGVAAALMTRAKQALVRGDLAALERDGTSSLARFQELGERWGQIQAANLLGTLAEIRGDYEQAMRLRGDGLRMAEELGLWNEVAYRLSALGRTALLMGDHDAADDFHRRARERALEQSNTLAHELAELGLALAARRRGDLDAAEAFLRHWLDWNRRIAPDTGTALILAELGFIAELRGDADAALALHQEGHAAAAATGDPRAVALALEGLAGAHALAGEHRRAARLLGTAAAARESVGAPLPLAERGDVDRIASALRIALGQEAFAAESIVKPDSGMV